MTAVLQLLQDIAQHLEVQTSVTPEQLRDLMKKTDLRRLTNRMEELAEPATSAMRDDPRPVRRLQSGILSAASGRTTVSSAQHLHFAPPCSIRRHYRGLNSHVARGERSSMTMSLA